MRQAAVASAEAAALRRRGDALGAELDESRRGALATRQQLHRAAAAEQRAESTRRAARARERGEAEAERGAREAAQEAALVRVEARLARHEAEVGDLRALLGGPQGEAELQRQQRHSALEWERAWERETQRGHERKRDVERERAAESAAAHRQALREVAELRRELQARGEQHRAATAEEQAAARRLHAEGLLVQQLSEALLQQQLQQHRHHPAPHMPPASPSRSPYGQQYGYQSAPRGPRPQNGAPRSASTASPPPAPHRQQRYDPAAYATPHAALYAHPVGNTGSPEFVGGSESHEAAPWLRTRSPLPPAASLLTCDSEWPAGAAAALAPAAGSRPGAAAAAAAAAAAYGHHPTGEPHSPSPAPRFGAVADPLGPFVPTSAGRGGGLGAGEDPGGGPGEGTGDPTEDAALIAAVKAQLHADAMRIYNSTG